jgi:hypothetical protein
VGGEPPPRGLAGMTAPDRSTKSCGQNQSLSPFQGASFETSITSKPSPTWTEDDKKVSCRLAGVEGRVDHARRNECRVSRSTHCSTWPATTYMTSS